MTCYHPIPAWYKRGPLSSTGKRPITFDPKQRLDDNGFAVPCGQCIGCRLKRSREWAARCVFEAKQHACNSFITLTYAPEHLPEDGSLHYEHFQLFMKRLRFTLQKEYGVQVRFFMCGEYGEKLQRPHYHAIIFGFDFPDKYRWALRGSNFIYRSPLLEKLWPYGYSSIGEVTFESAAYVARYCTKKVTGKESKVFYGDKAPEFSHASSKPGIARDWIEQYMDDVYVGDRLIVSADIFMNPPRYFDKVLEETDGMRFEAIKAERARKIKEVKEQNGEADIDRVRLDVKERIQKQKFRKLVRSFENPDAAKRL